MEPNLPTPSAPKNAAYTLPDVNGCTLPEVCWSHLRSLAGARTDNHDEEVIWKLPRSKRARIDPFVATLIERGYVRLRNDETCYQLTEAGRVVLTLYPSTGKPATTAASMGRKGRGKKKVLTDEQRAQQRNRLAAVRPRRHSSPE